MKPFQPSICPTFNTGVQASRRTNYFLPFWPVTVLLYFALCFFHFTPIRIHRFTYADPFTMQSVKAFHTNNFHDRSVYWFYIIASFSLLTSHQKTLLGTSTQQNFTSTSNLLYTVYTVVTRLGSSCFVFLYIYSPTVHYFIKLENLA